MEPTTSMSGMHANHDMANSNMINHDSSAGESETAIHDGEHETADHSNGMHMVRYKQPHNNLTYTFILH